MSECPARAERSSLRRRRAQTHFSPMTTLSMMTQLVSFEPLPTIVLRPTMQRFMPTFSPILL